MHTCIRSEREAKEQKKKYVSTSAYIYLMSFALDSFFIFLHCFKLFGYIEMYIMCMRVHTKIFFLVKFNINKFFCLK
jgi:hypothetical protein